MESLFVAAAAEEEREVVVEEFLVVWRRSEEGEGEAEGEGMAEAKRAGAEEVGGGGTQRRVRALVVFIACPFVGEKGVTKLSFI